MPKRQALVESRMDLHDLTQNEKARSSELRAANERVQKAQAALASARFD